MENDSDSTYQMQQYPFYQNLQKSIFQSDAEKSFVDKLLGRQDADKLHNLMQKEPLTKSDIEEILFLMTSIDQKIVNYDAWDRYVVVKLFPWVKDYSTLCKTWMIYEEQFNNDKFNNDFKNIEILNETKHIVAEITKYLQHNLKFLISVFLLVSNSTLSLNGAAFETLTTSRFEYSYPNVPLPQPQSRNTVIGSLFKTKK